MLVLKKWLDWLYLDWLRPIKDWLRPFPDMNTDLREKAKTGFQKDLFRTYKSNFL